MSAAEAVLRWLVEGSLATGAAALLVLAMHASRRRRTRAT